MKLFNVVWRVTSLSEILGAIKSCLCIFDAVKIFDRSILQLLSGVWSVRENNKINNRNISLIYPLRPVYFSSMMLTLSAGAVEYADCTSAEG